MRINSKRVKAMTAQATASRGKARAIEITETRVAITTTTRIIPTIIPTKTTIILRTPLILTKNRVEVKMGQPKVLPGIPGTIERT